jgi:colanic acid biosynthesis glycosyl transferase WcaI
MHIVLLFPMFFPDELGGCALYGDFAQYLKERGHQVTVITTFPFYPRWKYSQEDQKLDYRIDNWNGIIVHRVKMYIPEKPTGAKRILSDLSFLLNVCVRIPWRKLQADVALTAYPTLGTCIALGLMTPRTTPRMLMIQDFVVDAALELGMLRAPLLDRILPTIERWALSKFELISSISPQMVSRAREKVGTKPKVVETPNWIHQSLQMGVDRYRGVVSRDWHSKTISYSGNLGIKQGLGDFLEVFIQENKDWKLIIRGQGAARKELENMLSGQTNIHLEDLLEEEAHCQSLLRMPLMLITQKTGSGASFLPSKLLSALVAGVPVLAFCERTTPLAQEVQEGGYGWVVEPGYAGNLRETLQAITLTELQKKSEIALKRAELFSRERILNQYETAMKELAFEDVSPALTVAQTKPYRI